MKCVHCKNEIVDIETHTGPKKSKFCSGRCKRNHQIVAFRRRQKEKAVALLGSKCNKCGYDKCLRALSFHHKDRSNKTFSIAHPDTKSWQRVKLEVEKCELLCLNCHMEVEDNLYWDVAQ